MITYKPFPKKEILTQWDKLLNMKRDEVVDLYNQWQEIDKENKLLSSEAFNKKSVELDNIEKALKSVGVDVYKYKTKGFFKEKNGYQAWFKTNIYDIISKRYPYYSSGVPCAHWYKTEVNGVSLSNNKSPTDLIELYDRITSQYATGIENINRNNKLFIKSIEYATQNNIDIEGLNTKSIISLVDGYAKEKYREEELPNGTEVYLKHSCDNCSTYIVGDHRCSCGNRRIDIIIEGNIIDGFYYYPEPY